ncbi:putative short-chain dehydrogenase [Podospora didyma]|uniref:Short-chain dehydrogenase n=1 Tax=Podospora didyma TaxID=330526 RepID=A0AAE0K4R1_9PEZI|nr:putative short-chain dehydrogenase [Podospora didyma]
MHFLLGQFLVRPPYPTGSYAGKTIIITGSNQGLGKEAARHYARLGASRIILAVRSLDKGHDAKHDIEHTTQCGPNTLQVWQLDMASYSSVCQFAARVRSELDRVDIALLNAGLAPARHAVAEGNEVLFTVNCISTVLLAVQLVPKLQATAARFSVRPVMCLTSSVAHTFTPFAEKSAPEGQIFAALNKRAATDGSYGAREDLYSISKLLPILAVRAMAEKCSASKAPITINLADPGLCWSGLARDFSGGVGNWLFMTVVARSTEVGSRTLVHAAAQGPESHGCYLSGCQIEEPSPVITGPGGKELQERVWKELVTQLEAIQPGGTTNALSG